ncbi:MAG: DnaJ domain-containing protein [Desulfobacterales bacterium]|nr:DnaJ domain-containing protein [Desulfobacterales bacterium]
MNPMVKLVLVLFGLAYLITPVDLIPDLILPWIGWLDDGLVLWSVYYLIRYGELPWFLFKKRKPKSFSGKTGRPGTPPAGQSRGRSGNNKDHNGSDNFSGKKKGPSKKNPQENSANSNTKSPYEVLGVSKGAPWTQIQEAYKTKAKQYHPDKLSHLGDDFSSLANKRFLEIQEAYNRLKVQYRK